MRYVILAKSRSWPWFWRLEWRVSWATDDYDLALKMFRALSGRFPGQVRMYEQVFAGTYSANRKMESPA
jgi:hypothetical protein